MLHVHGDLLTIDLEAREWSTENVDDVLEAYVGGRGVGTRLVHDRVPFDADPLGPENSLVFATGPMQTSRMSFTGRTSLTGVSPLTDGLLSSNAGGFLSRNLAGTGHAAVEITGASDELLAVHVTDDGVTFEEIPELEGAVVSETCDTIEERHGLGPDHVACIGPAGENEVRFASVMTTEKRAFGRGGLGAVLGAKNCKAVTFAGESTHDVSIPDVQMDVHREAAQSDHVMKRQGTTSMTDFANQVGALPTRYFSERSFEGAEGINGDRVEEKKYETATCSACAFACKLPTRDEASGIETEGPEYETVMAFGSNCGVDDVVDVMRSNEQCDEYGMDTISCGDVVAAYLDSEDAFGHVDLIEDVVEDIARREEVGDLLAEGIDRCHEDLGVENWSVKGMEFPAHDGRHLNGQGLGFATSNRGADHMYATFYSREYPLVGKDDALPPEGLDETKANLLVEHENARAFEDCGVVCRFSRDFLTRERYEQLFDADYDDLLAVGDRVVTLERHFNNRRGFDRDDDVLPYELPNFETARGDYYETRGWSQDGTVPAERISILP
ncbi:aldehyde ferredoxin oxidoreductase C-terminal domain-containing protein [Haloarculaceae archaeon H-GB2-1]|nr:aldehyde ferredoxin oxidoreductase C-terminal domain-containing protein [Haloarculaceae archaeon H-GB1-1]MEA5408050.1 aldehyde ferredoxin oxidoreductase C-terminal domain-containing protein [Haloarculaceae archaeon H-GB2-1]